MKLKTLKNIKIALYVLCFASLALPMNFDAHTDKWTFGINYVLNLFSSGADKEGIYWFLYYFILYIMPSSAEIVFCVFSKKGVISDIMDVLIGSVASTVMFCFFISLKHSPAGIMVVMALQATLAAVACARLLVRIFFQGYNDMF